MIIHFEELWEKCENLNKEISSDELSSSIIDELMMKLNLYKLIDSQKDITDEDKQKVKSRTLGEILLTLTNLSLKDNINVYEALATAYKFRSISHYNEKYNILE